MSDENVKRKNYVVNRVFQFRIIGTFLFSVLGAFILFTIGMLMYYWLTGAADEADNNEYIVHNQVVAEVVDGQEVFATKETVTKRWNLIVPPLLLNNAFIMVVFALIGVFYTHRIAGPIFRIKADIIKVLEGDTDVRVVVRKNDKFQDLAESVNLLLEELQKSRQE